MKANQPDPNALISIARLTYLIAMLMIVIPLTQVAVAIGGFQPTTVAWRVGTVGMLSDSMLTPLLGLFLILLAARLLERTVAQRVVTVVSGLAGAILLPVSLLFTLDVVEVRGNLPQALRRGYELQAGKALLIQLLVLTALLAIVVVGWRSFRRVRPAKLADEEAASLLMARAAR